MVSNLGLDKELFVDVMMQEGVFMVSSQLLGKKRSVYKKKAQEFLDLYFQGKINPKADDILLALSYVPYKQNIMMLFENKEYRYDVFGLSDIFQNTRSVYTKRKIAISILLDFWNSDDARFMIEQHAEEFQNILTSDDVAFIITDFLERDLTDNRAAWIANVLNYDNYYRKVYRYLKEKGGIERRDSLLGRIPLCIEGQIELRSDIPIEYWVEVQISLDQIEEKLGLFLNKKQLEGRLKCLLKSGSRLYLIEEIAKRLGRKITSKELGIYIKNSQGVMERIDEGEVFEFTDDQFLKAMRSWKRFYKPSSLRWFWENYHLDTDFPESHKTLLRMYKEKPDDVKKVLEEILEALFNAPGFEKEDSVIFGLLRDIGRGMTEEERKKYFEAKYGLQI